MKALHQFSLGEPTDVMRVVDVPIPEPGENEVRVRVAAAPISFPDLLMCRGGYQVQPDLPASLGIEVSGFVDAVGPEVSGLRIGDRVIGLTTLPFGGYAEYAITDSRVTFAAPKEMGAAEAASMFVAYQTSWFGLHRRAGLKSSDVVLVHAAAGGVGSAAVELAKAAGCAVIAVVGDEGKVEVARRLGADIVVNRKEQDFVAVTNEFTDGKGADIIYDPVGGETYTRSTKCIASEGTIVVLGFAGGEIQSAKLNHALIKNYSIAGFVWGRFRRNDLQAVVDCHGYLCELAAQGLVNPVVDSVVDLEAVGAAMERLGSGATVGRVVYIDQTVDF